MSAIFGIVDWSGRKVEQKHLVRMNLFWLTTVRKAAACDSLRPPDWDRGRGTSRLRMPLNASRWLLQMACWFWSAIRESTTAPSRSPS